jgi:sialate O-acetylesterase
MAASFRVWFLRCALLLALAAVARADLTLGPLFCDGAVLQCDKPVAVWGSAAPGEVVRVEFAGQIRLAATGPDGRWLTMLDAMPANAVGADLKATGKSATVTIHDVLLGEVWLCAGQSNMEFPVKDAANAEKEIAAADQPLLRHILIAHHTAEKPQDTAETSGWKPATPANVGDFSAVAYFFGRDLQQRLGVPVGLIDSSYGGTPIEAWMSANAIDSDPAFAFVRERWRDAVASYPSAAPEYLAKLTAWRAADTAVRLRGDKARAAWQRDNPRPHLPPGGPGDPWAPAGLYNGMINPLVPYALRGVIWYHGESNASHPAEYRPLFSALINSWRAHFAQGDIPFFWVNLANFRPPDPTDLAWARVREAQTQTLALPNTGQAIAIDVGDPNDIHPRNKQEVGRRLALLAKHRVYGLSGDDSGPIFASAAREGATMRVRFTHAAAGLVAHNHPPSGLELAGADRVFRPAVGKIDHDSLIVSSPTVKEPVAVRYAYRNAPDANLFGGNGLPVVPFRSDDW